MALAGGAEQVRPPDEEVARPVLRRVGVLARHFDLAGLQPLGDIVLRLDAGGLRRATNLERIGLELRGGRQPPHPLGADVVVDQAGVPIAVRRRRRQDFLGAQRLVAPLVGMGVPGRRRVHVPGRTRPVESEGERLPAGLRPKLFLADIMAPAAAGLADASAHHQHVDDAAVVHIHVVPVVQAGPEDDHRLAVGLFGVQRELAGDRRDLLAIDAGDLFCPCRRVGAVVVVAPGRPFAAQAAVQAVIRAEQIEHRRDDGVAAVGQPESLHRNVAAQDVRMLAADEVVRRLAAEVRELDADDLVVVLVEDLREPEADLRVARPFFEIPAALVAPAMSDGAVGRDRIAGAVVDRDRLPVGVGVLAERALQIGRTQEAAGLQTAVLPLKTHQHRHVGVPAAVVLEVLALTVQVELTQDDVAHRHGERRVGALLRREPDVAELRRFGIVRADYGGLGAPVARFRVEVRVRRPGLRDVRAPE